MGDVTAVAGHFAADMRHFSRVLLPPVFEPFDKNIVKGTGEIKIAVTRCRIVALGGEGEGHILVDVHEDQLAQVRAINRDAKIAIGA